MKTIFAFMLVLFSFTVLADSYSDLDNALAKVLNRNQKGRSTNGQDCEVSRTGRQIQVVSLATGCINPENNTIDPDCFSQFLYNQAASRMEVKKLEISDRKIVAEIKSKDSEQYASAVTGKVEVSIGGTIDVKVSSKKGLFGYKQVLDCSI